MLKIRYVPRLLQDDFCSVTESIFALQCTDETEWLIHDSKILHFQQDFCKPTNWPPLSELKLIVGGEGESCVDTCVKKELTCEPKFFKSLNTRETFER